MKNNYKNYVEPILKSLSPDASMELAYDKIFQNYLKNMRSPWALFHRENQEVILNNMLWTVFCLYRNTHFFNNAEHIDWRHFRAVFPQSVGDAKVMQQKAMAAYDKLETLFVPHTKSSTNPKEPLPKEIDMQLPEKVRQMQVLVGNARLEYRAFIK